MTSQYVYSRGVGQYRDGEIHNLICSRTYQRDGSRRGVIFCHSVGRDGDDQIREGASADKILALAAAGYPVIAADLSALSYAGANWGNDDHIDAIGDAWAYLVNTFGAKSDAVALYAVSMGALGALNWARQNPSSVCAIALGLPAMDLQALYALFTGGINAAYGVSTEAGLSAYYPTHSPAGSSGYGGTNDLEGLPINLWVSPNDTVTTNVDEAEAWGAAGASKSVTAITAPEHRNGAAYIDAQEVVQFFDDNGGRA